MLNNSLTLENISKRFASRPGSSSQLQVLDNIQLDIAPGEFISIVGASGCGKSTLLRLILGLDEEYEGRILLNGQRQRLMDQIAGELDKIGRASCRERV